MSINTCREGVKRSQALPSGSQCQDQRPRAQTGTREVPSEHQETLFTGRVPEPRHRLPREVVESLSLEDTRNPSGGGPGPPALGGPA